MKLQSLKIGLVGTLFFACTGVVMSKQALADEHQETSTKEQQKVQVDGSTGTTTHQQSTETKKDSYHASPNGAHAESEHSAQGAAETHSADGATAATKTSDESKTSVHTDENGGTVIDHKKEHAETNSVH
ncbi:MAG: hypothetical protein U0136_13020 [Bdellovibrionota bacterium]